MKQTTIYKVTVNPQAAARQYEGLFLQCPSRNELTDTIRDMAENFPVSMDGKRQDRVSDLNNAAAVVEHCEDFVPPLFGKTELRVEAASIVIGQVTIEAIEAYGRDPQSVLEQLVA